MIVTVINFCIFTRILFSIVPQIRRNQLKPEAMGSSDSSRKFVLNRSQNPYLVEVCRLLRSILMLIPLLGIHLILFTFVWPFDWESESLLRKDYTRQPASNSRILCNLKSNLKILFEIVFTSFAGVLSEFSIATAKSPIN